MAQMVINTQTQTDLGDALKAGIQGDVLLETIDRTIYSTDASCYKMMPACVVVPKDVDDIQATVRIARDYGFSIVPRGGGTSLSGQSVGTGIVLDLSKNMNQVIQINVNHAWAEVQAGMVLSKLNNLLAPHGLKVGPDPSSALMATIGGMVGNNSTGAHSIIYGMMADHVEEVEVVLADGSLVRFSPKTPEQLDTITGQDTLEGKIYREIPALVHEYAHDISTRYPKTWRNVAGYNLNRIHQLISSGSSLNLAPLIVGSEGTLGIITAVRVKLVDVPQHTHLSLVHFDSLRQAVALTQAILAHNPSAVELIDDYVLTLAKSSPEWGALLPHYFHQDPAAVLMVEFYGRSPDELTSQATQLAQNLQDIGHNGHIVHLSDPIDISTVWNIRKAGIGVLMSKRGDEKPLTFVDDATVPVEHLADFIHDVEMICQKLDVRPAMMGHASAGCIHITPTLNLRTAAGMAKMRELSQQILQLAIQYDGSTTGEHGEGIARSYFNEQLYGELLHRAFRQVKGIFDAENMMNPGKIIDAPEPWDPSTIRLGTDYATDYAPNVTFLDFSDDGGFAGAVEMCNGQGFCRKTDSGIMCPSYMATRDEKHSTRGRANALRNAMSGDLGPDGLINDHLYDVLDLCLECKACKRECPSLVDMAKLKSEFLAQYQQAKGIPLRSRLFANINRISRLSSRPIIRPMVNWAFSNPLIRSGLQATLGIAKKRSIPVLAKQSFHQWYHKNRVPNPVPYQKRVLLWDDTFLTYNEPEIGIAATLLLEAAGFRVEILQRHDCCGRPMISKGLLQQARQVAKKNVETLLAYVEAGILIIGLEPSCISAFRDEYPDLLRSDAAQKVADNTFFFEEFYASLLDDRPDIFSTPDTPKTVYVHGHCHQRTLIGTSAMMKMLAHLPNTTVHLIDSGCCGMAGSFGYEQKHYDISLKIGSDRLFPAVLAAEPDAYIVAPGTSCRHQIHDGTQRQAIHFVVLMAQYLSEAEQST
jgi:FAD/FMN-containing dehydrogenase/Fe-S oxidoreductase